MCTYESVTVGFSLSLGGSAKSEMFRLLLELIITSIDQELVASASYLCAT